MHRMHVIGLVMGVATAVVPPVTQAEARLDAGCGIASSYDIAIGPRALVFERAAPAPGRLEWNGERLRIDGVETRLGAEAQDRMAAFAAEARRLLPQLRRIAAKGVRVALAELRREVTALDVSAEVANEVGRALDAKASSLQSRIAVSADTRDWHADRLHAEAEALLAELAPPIAGDLAQQAVDAAVSGDLAAAAALRARIDDLHSGMAGRLEGRIVAALRPEVTAACPSLRRLLELQRDLRDGRGRALELLESAAR